MFPLRALHGLVGWRAGRQMHWASGSCLVLLASRMQCRFPRSQIIFFGLPRRCCRIGIFFPPPPPLPSRPSQSQNTSFSTFLPQTIVAGTALLQYHNLLLLAFCSLQIPLARSSGHRDRHIPCYLGCIRRYLNTQGNESLSVHPNCTFQGSLGSSRLGPPNSSQTVSVSSPQSRSSS